MPEAIAVLFVSFVSVGVYIYAHVQARDPSKRDPVEESKMTEQKIAWLQERLERAKKEKWDQHMIVSLTDQLQAAKSAS